MTAARKLSKIVRVAADASGTPYPIEILPTADAPKLVGESYHYTTKGGRPIHHPSAYSKRGWSNMVYHHSTLSIRVGRDWLFQQGVLPVPSARG